MATKYDCHACKKQVTATKNNRYRSHSGGDGEPCEMSSAEIPEHVLAHPVGADDAPDVPREGVDYAVCPQCERKVKLTRLGYFEPHNATLKGGDRCPTSGVRAKHARKTETVPLPGDEPLPPSAAVPEVKDSARPVANRGLAIEPGRPPHEYNLARDPMPSPEPTTTPDDSSSPVESSPATSSSAAEPPASAGDPSRTAIDWDKVGDLKHLNSPESTTISKPSTGQSGGPPATSSDALEPTVGSVSAGPFHLAPLLDERILQPFSHILQPFEAPPRVKLADAMSDRGKEIAARLREIFYAYTNRDHSSNRSAQKTLGPSEAGSPCDRQIAMKLMGIQPVNPQEGWAPFVGTAVHVELAKMFEWANGSGSGRYVTEMPLTFGSAVVPRGTSDLLDRVLFMIMDHKLMGRWSLDKLIQNGPSETYRIQGQIYALGAVLAGEKVREVAIIGWPRQESSLDKLYVHVEPFDRKVAEAALQRVERIAEEAFRLGQGPHSQLEVAQEFAPGDDCKWCPFHLKNDKNFSRGCPGK